MTGPRASPGPKFLYLRFERPAEQSACSRPARRRAVKALLVPVDGPPRDVDLPGGDTRFMRSIKALIGAECTERIQVTSRWEAWLDENGTAAGKPVNQAATLVAQSFGFESSILGPVVIVGVDKDTAEPAALSPAQAGAILE